MRALVAIAMFVAACGYPPLDSSGGDAGAGHDVNPTHDGKGSIDAADLCQAPASYGAATATDQSGDYFPGNQNNPDELDYAGSITATDVLAISLFDGTPPFPDTLTTGTFNLAGETDFSNCGTCVLVAAQCNNCDLSTGAGVGSWYMASAGSLKLTSLTPTIAGSLTGATLIHVAIDFSNGNTTVSGDGCTTKITSVSFSSPVTQH